MERNAWCFWMMLGAGGFFGVLAGLASPLVASVAFLVLLLVSLAQVMRVDDREFCRQLRAGKD